MDRLTLEVLAAQQPARAITFTPPSRIGKTVECAACAYKALDIGDQLSWRVQGILEQSEITCPSQFPWQRCHCGVLLQFTD